MSCIIFVNCLCKLQSNNIFRFVLGYCLFYANDKATYQPCADRSPNTEFIRENNLEPISHPVEVLDAISLSTNKKGGRQKTHSILYTQDLLEWYNEKAVGMGTGLYLLSQCCTV